MAMDKISGSQVYPRSLADKFQTTPQKPDTEARTGAADNASVEQKRTTEKAEISDAAHDLMHLRQAVDTGRAALAALPDVRQDKVEQAKTRLAQGYYDSPAVRDEIAAKLDKVIGDMDRL